MIPCLNVPRSITWTRVCLTSVRMRGSSSGRRFSSTVVGRVSSGMHGSSAFECVTWINGKEYAKADLPSLSLTVVLAMFGLLAYHGSGVQLVSRKNDEGGGGRRLAGAKYGRKSVSDRSRCLARFYIHALILGSYGGMGRSCNI